MQTWAIDDVELADLEAFAPHQRRQEAMQSVEVKQREEYRAGKRLQAGAGVGRAVAQDGGADAVGDARLNALERRVLAPDAPAGDEAGPLAAFPQQYDGRWNERGIVLAVAVERHDDRRT